MMIHVLEEKWKETPPSWESCGYSTAQNYLLLMVLSQSLHTWAENGWTALIPVEKPRSLLTKTLPVCSASV